MMIRENGIRKADDKKIHGAMIILHLTYNHLLGVIAVHFRKGWFNMKKLIFSCYLSAFITLLISVYVIFFSGLKDLQVQGIYWFGIAILCFILPSMHPVIEQISSFRVDKGAIEFKFREIEIHKEKTQRQKIVCR